ncbi:DUF1631 domain-containing protein [Thiocystis violacea]|uniref:DUF1631 domain-containing protein n=1 Tax=Thiocystis violacea TaxID=13725 RepID=UPI0019047DEA|nr:DUF1631 domain-containing protein [Thiocystis violacea]MBK1719971.1 hypothetical protein [Thiocystis violacea]
MADHATSTSNVLPFGGKETNLTTAMLQDAAAILAVCRDRLVDSVSAVFTRHIGRANDEFLAMADRASSHEHQQICFGAMHFLANRSPILLQQFRNAYVGAFDASLASHGAVHPRPHGGLPDELSLVDDEDFEQDLALTKLTSRAAFNCSQQLVALDRRLAALLRVPRVSQEDNPLHPGALYKAMLQSLTEMDAGRQLALALVQSFERHTSAELPGIYAEINRYLAETGILPTIPLSAPQASTGDQVGAGMGGGGGGGFSPSGQGIHGPPMGGAPMGYGGVPGPPRQTNEDIFGQLLRAFQSLATGPSGPSGPSGPPGWPAAAPMGQVPGQGAVPQSFGSQQLIEALGDLQRGHFDPSAMPGLGSVRIDPFGGNAVQQIRATPMANWSPPMDAMTMDIVAMLFDAIFNDPDLPATVRAEIAKLQIPVLKVALLDKSFFSDRKHPARRLLDAIANAGLGRGEKDGPRLLAKVSSVVEEIVKGFDSDVQIFASQVEGLEAFLRAEESSAPSPAKDVLGELARRERREVAASRVAAEVELRVNRSGLPALIADFLDRRWRLVLVDVFVRVGDSDPEWVEALRLMDELIWSTQPKTSARERDRLVLLLPDLLKQLRNGLGRMELADTWDDFFSELIQLHVAALRRDVSPELYPQGARPPGGVEVPWRGAAASEPPEVGPKPPSESAASASATLKQAAMLAADDKFMGLVQALEVGAWVEFQSVRGTRNTLRLNWVSEFKRVYLFTNRQGENAMTLAAGSLAEHFRKGTARLLSHNPLTDRAVAQVLEKVMPASAEPGAVSRPRGYAWE